MNRSSYVRLFLMMLAMTVIFGFLMWRKNIGATVVKSIKNNAKTTYAESEVRAGRARAKPIETSYFSAKSLPVRDASRSQKMPTLVNDQAALSATSTVNFCSTNRCQLCFESLFSLTITRNEYLDDVKKKVCGGPCKEACTRRMPNSMAFFSHKNPIPATAQTEDR